MSLVDQLPTLLGVVAGAGASYVGSVLTDRARRRHTLLTRWDTQRATAYVDFMHAVREELLLARGIAAARGLSVDIVSVPPVQDLSAALNQLATADARRAAARESVLLFGDQPTIVAAGRLQTRLWRLEWRARGMLELDPTAWKEDFAGFLAARDDFYACARGTLGVPGGFASVIERSDQTGVLLPALTSDDIQRSENVRLHG
jgi:hypothetical protein